MFPNKTCKTNKTLAEYKSRAINELELKEYYEDDERIAEHLARTCINTKIILVESHKKVKEKEMFIEDLAIC